MNWDQIEGHWQDVKGTLREKWGKLTDSDIETIKGKKDQLIGVLKRHYGVERERAQHEIDEWLKTLDQRLPGHSGQKPPERGMPPTPRDIRR